MNIGEYKSPRLRLGGWSHQLRQLIVVTLVIIRENKIIVQFSTPKH